MTILNEGRHPGEFILSEGQRAYSRDNVTIAASQTIEPGGLLAAQAVAAEVAADASAGAGNTGGATITMGSPAVSGEVKHGRYKGIATGATAVSWEDPDGKKIGNSTHGTPFSKGGVTFTITAAGDANVTGDEFYVDVILEAGDVEYVAYNPAGTDGSQNPSAIAIYGAATGAGEKAKIAAITRQAEAKGVSLSWPTGITADQKAAAIVALAQSGIVVR